MKRSMTRSKISPWLMLGLLLLPTKGLHAEDNFPIWQYQATPPRPQGRVVCAPIPHDQQGRPVQIEQPATHWGAIATGTYGNGTIVGTSLNLPDKPKAEQAALNDCQSKGGADCKIAVSYGNGCAALVGNDADYTTAAADVMQKYATQVGMKTCSNTGHTRCHVVYAACSPAQ